MGENAVLDLVVVLAGLALIAVAVWLTWGLAATLAFTGACMVTLVVSLYVGDRLLYRRPE